MELSEAIYGRRAVRAFADRVVDKALLETLLEAAIQAPSAVNEQPWEFTVIRNKVLLDRVAATAKSYALENAEKGRLPPHLKQRLANKDLHILYHAPVLVVIAAKSSDWAIEDGSLAAENLMLSAFAHGLGSCWIGFAQRWLMTEDGRRVIGLTEGYIPVAPIVLGYPQGIISPVPRRPAQTHWLD